jgi:hypothetical protein
MRRVDLIFTHPLAINRMKFFATVFLMVTAGTADHPGKFRKHAHHQLNLPHEVVFRGLAVDMDQYRPPAHIPGMESEMAEISRMEAQEKKEIEAEEKILLNVQKEYLNSDLHKEAMTLKFLPDDEEN